MNAAAVAVSVAVALWFTLNSLDEIVRNRKFPPGSMAFASLALAFAVMYASGEWG